tara:strand:+ start:547 stop:732 length:186 start_codon:yes stop_codon:yes gene_type:complete
MEPMCADVKVIKPHWRRSRRWLGFVPIVDGTIQAGLQGRLELTALDRTLHLVPTRTGAEAE